MAHPVGPALCAPNLAGGVQEGSHGKEAVPLFLTQQSLKPVSGPAVQTAAFASAFPDWRHVHWDASSSTGVQRSFRLQSPLFAAWPFAAGAGPFKASLRRLGADWWSNGALKPGRARRLDRWLGGAPNVIYAAPTTHAQAARMRGLVDHLGLPFVLHYWDMLDGGMEAAGPDTLSLLSRAHAVFALSNALVEELRPFRSDCTALMFTRGTASATARPHQRGPLKIALIGHVASYDVGLQHLAVALRALQTRGLELDLVYVGPSRQLRKAHTAIRVRARRTGFLASSQDRDAALAQCHIAFLSGPTAAPDRDARSRFSIPSRLLDFAATGLPIVAAVHPRSACAGFLKNWGPEAVRLCEGPGQIQDAILSLVQIDAWMSAHKSLLSIFTKLRHEPPEQALRAALNAAALARMM